jgi:hypothetical protein
MPVPDATILAIIRNAIGDSAGDIFEPEEIDVYWEDAEDQHGTDNTRLVRQQAILDLLDVRIAAAAEEVSYKANEESESLSDKVKALERLRAAAQKKLDALEEKTRQSVRILGMRKVPARRREYPDA